MVKPNIAFSAFLQHLQRGIMSLSKFAIALHLPFLRGTLRHVIFLMSSLRLMPHHLPSLATARASDSALPADLVRIIYEFNRIVLYL